MAYRATPNPDGSLTVHDVPIFCECTRGDFDANAGWLRAAFKKAQQAQAEGYFAPLHIRHHDGAAEVRPAGYFRVTRLGAVQMAGASRTAIFADLIVTDEWAQGDILKQRLPYRSVEIFDTAKPAIDSLALLDHEPPYLELPMLFVASVDGVQTQPDPLFTYARMPNPWRDGAETTRPLAACFRRGRSATLLFQDMETEQMADTPADGASSGDGSISVDSIVSAIKDGSISVADMEAIVAAVQARMGDGADDAMPDDSEPAPAAAPGGESMQKDDTDSVSEPKDEGAKVEMAAAQGEIVALRARLDERDATDKRNSDVATAMKRLEGRPLGSDLEAKLVGFHREHGAKAFAAHVDAIAKTFAAVEGTDPRAEMFGAVPSVPEVAQKYADKGPDAVRKAAEFSRQYDELRKYGGIRASRESHVEINMQRFLETVRN